MARKRLLWQLFPSYLIVAVLVLVVVCISASNLIRNFYFEETASNLRSHANLLAVWFGERLDQPDRESVHSLCRRWGAGSEIRISVILPDGEVIGDSQEDPDQMELHTGRYRPEIRAALTGTTTQLERYSQTLRREMLYLAIPIFDSDPDVEPVVSCVLRVSMPLTAISESMATLRTSISICIGLAVVLFTIISLLISRRISRPLEELKLGAESYARGEFSVSLPTTDVDEIAGLSESMLHMASQLEDRIDLAVHERNEREAILTSMVEGVLAVDDDEKIVSMNQACAGMLRIDAAAGIGKSVQEVIRISELQELIGTCLRAIDPFDALIRPFIGEEQFLQITGAPLKETNGTHIGAVFVLNDVTKLHQLERIRSDFVTNVSHELRTPITAIKGAVETLNDGAIEELSEATRFLAMIERQTDRLNCIIEDLLELSRIEQSDSLADDSFSTTRLLPLIETAVRNYSHKAKKKAIALAVVSDGDATARVIEPLIITAVGNLIENAIKYSDNQTRIEIAVASDGEQITIRVTDEGGGVAEEHLPRLFERFYRVDKARSRSLGGTGLGLAIVKHIVHLHQGGVDVKSKLGVGSVFTIRLPLPSVNITEGKRERVPN